VVEDRIFKGQVEIGKEGFGFEAVGGLAVVQDETPGKSNSQVVRLARFFRV
jgi:hypothetical protein